MKILTLLTGLLLVSWNAFAQWQFAGGLPHATINTLHRFEETVLAGTTGGLLYFNPNEQRWHSINGSNNVSNVVAIQSSDNKLYAITDPTYNALAVGNFLLSTDNFGVTWDTIFFDAGAIRYFTGQQDTLLLGSTAQGMLFSANGGKQWAARTSIDADFSYLKRTPQGIFGFTQPGRKLWRTTNWGLSWQEVPLPIASSNYIPLPHENRVVIQQLEQIFVLNDDLSWSMVPPPDDASYFELCYADEQQWLGFAEGIYYQSFDKGAHWQSLGAGTWYTNYVYLNQQFYLAGFNEVFTADHNLHTIQPITAGLEVASQIKSLARSADVLLASGNGYTYRSDNHGTSWQLIPGLKSAQLFSDEQQNFYALAYSDSLADQAIWYSRDDGQNWAILSHDLHHQSTFAIGNNELFSAAGSNIYQHEWQNGVYTTQLISTGFSLSTVEELKADAAQLIAVDYLGRIIRREHAGEPWQDITYNVHRYNKMLTYDVDIYILHQGVFAVNNISRHVFKLDQTQQTWADLELNLDWNHIAFIKNVGTQILMGVPGEGLFISSDGKTWLNVNDQIPHFNPLAAASDAAFVYVGMGGGGLWKRPIADFDQALVIKEAERSADFQVQFFPNPAHDFVNITFSGNVVFTEIFTLTLFDLGGKPLLSQQFSGKEQHNLNISYLSKGMYVAQIKSKLHCIAKNIIIQ